MTDSIKKILIVGGGTSGWITATFLNKFLNPSRCSVTLVESAALGTIGVGEATVPPLVAFLRLMAINEDEFLRECHATYKLGIKFINWNSGHDAPAGDDAIWHPFGPVGAPLVEGLPLFHHWLKNRQAGHTSSYSSYSLQALLGDMNRAPRTLHDASVIIKQGAYAFHLDAKLFAAFLAKVSVQRGVRRIVDDVSNVTLDERGYVKSVSTRNNGELTADLYIDCSGFSGLLVEKALGDGFVDWSKHLFCDRAIAMPLPLEGPIFPYTRSTALNAGWSWRIPLSHRVGSGYVYSSHFISQEQATRELIEHTGQDPDQCNPIHINMRIGRRENFWVRNCVSIGLAAGFLEPLESTGLFLIQKGVELLLDFFPDTDFNPALTRRYNLQMNREFEHARDFIILHYLLNRRDDDGFWRANRHAPPPDSLAQTLEFYEQTGIVDWQGGSLFRDASFYSIVTGFDRLPRVYHPMLDHVDGGRAWRMMEKIREQNLALAKALPDHGALIEAVNAAKLRASR